MTPKKPAVDTLPIAAAPNTKEERRSSPRVKIGRRVLLRPAEPKFPEEVQSTVNTSREGFYFKTHLRHYYVGMRVRVILDYDSDDPCNAAPSFAQIVRVDALHDGSAGIAVRIEMR